jgi:peptide/nickel transport system substrate-binding protein
MVLYRKRFLSLGIASALFLSLLTAALPAQAATGANCKVNTPIAKAQCDLITVALVGKVLSLDPKSPTRTNNQNYVTRVISQGQLFRFDAQNEPQPDLVDTYSVSSDGLVWTFNLKKGLKYSDNKTPVTADDVVFSYEYNLNPPVPGFTAVKSVVAKSTSTVEVTLSAPFSDFLRAVAGMYWTINPRSLAEGKSAYWNKPVSAGPFVVKNWVVGSDEILLEANRNYWAKPAVKQVRFIAIPDPVTRVLAIKQGTIDYAFDLPQSIGANQLRPPQFRPEPFQLQGNFTLDFNLRNTAGKPWSDPKVRQALSHAIDRKQFSDLAFNGDVTPSCAITYPSHPNYTCVKPGGIKQDLALARKMLSETKWPTGFNIRLSTFNRPGWADAASVIASQWAKIGVIATVAAEPDAVGSAGQVQGTFEVQLSGYGSSNISTGLSTYIGSAGAWTVWSGSKADDSLPVKYDAAFTKKAQVAVLKEIEQMIWDESAHIPVGQRSGWGASVLPKGIFSAQRASDNYFVKQTPALGSKAKPKKKKKKN